MPPKPEILHSKNEGGLLSISWKNGDICPVNYGFTHYYLLLYAVALDDVDPYPGKSFENYAQVMIFTPLLVGPEGVL